MPDSSGETTQGLLRRRRTPNGPSPTERAEEALRLSLDEGGAIAEGPDAPVIETGLLATAESTVAREALSAPAAHVGGGGLFTAEKLGPAFWLAVAFMGLVVFAAVFANVLPLANPHATFVGPIDSAPTWHNLFGTDQTGQDIFSQVVYGARISVIIGLSSVVVGLGVGGTIGLVAGFYRGFADASVVWVTDVLLTLPGLVLALTLVAFLGSSTLNVVLVIDILSIPIYARIARAASLAVSQRDFVLSGLSLGARPRRILWREVMPLVMIPIAAYAPIGASLAIIIEGALAYLGLAPAGQLSWGDTIAAGQQQLINAPQLTFAPMIVFFLTLLSLNYIGQRFTSILDPRQAAL